MSPKSKEQFDEIRQKSREKIMEVALELFAESGYHNTSISQIAKAASVSKGLMYNYFDSKEDLLHAIVAQAIDEFEKLEGVLNGMEGTAAEKLRWTTEMAIQLVTSDVKHWKFLTLLGLQTDVLTSLKDLLKVKSENAIAMTASLFEEMGYKKPQQEAFIYGALLDGILLQYVSMTELEMDYPIKEMTQVIFERYNL